MIGSLHFSKDDLERIIRKHLIEMYSLGGHLTQWVPYTPQEALTNYGGGRNVETPIQFNVIVEGVEYENVNVTADLVLN